MFSRLNLCAISIFAVWGCEGKLRCHSTAKSKGICGESQPDSSKLEEKLLVAAIFTKFKTRTSHLAI